MKSDKLSNVAMMLNLKFQTTLDFLCLNARTYFFYWLLLDKIEEKQQGWDMIHAELEPGDIFIAKLILKHPNFLSANYMQ